MQTSSADYKTAIAATDREIRGYIKFNNTFTLNGADGLISFKVTQNAMEAERFCVGSCTSSFCEASFFNSGLEGSGVSLANSYFDAYAGVVTDPSNDTVEYICCGRFWVSEISRGKETTKIVGYDIAGRLSVDYVPTVTAGVSGYLVMDILNDIIDQTYINGGTHFTTYGDSVYVPEIYEGTCRQQWGWLCTLVNGANATSYTGTKDPADLGYMKEYVPGNGEVNPYSISQATTYMDGLSIGDEFTVTSFTTGTTDNPIVIGNGTGLYGLNPYLDNAAATAIETAMDNYQYYPATIHFRGDPCIDIMDELSVSDGTNTYKVVVMKIETTFNGGLEQTINCFGDSEEYYALSTSPTQSQINQVSNLVQEIQQAIETADGGVITKILDVDGTWKELVIANNQDLSQATSVWRFNINGLAHSDRYQGGTYTLAMDTQGRIVANVIQTGILQDALGNNSWNLDTGAFSITNGSINITTNSLTEDAIWLKYGDNETLFNPYEFRVVDRSIGKAARVNAGSINMWENFFSPQIRMRSTYSQDGMALYDANGTLLFSGIGSQLYLYNSNNAHPATVYLYGYDNNNGGVLELSDASGTLRQKLDGNGKLWQYDANGKKRTYLEYGDIFLYNSSEKQTVHLGTYNNQHGYIYLYDGTSNTLRSWWDYTGLKFADSSGTLTAEYPSTGLWNVTGNKTGSNTSMKGKVINLGVVSASEMSIANNATDAVVCGAWLAYCVEKYPNCQQCIFEGVALANSYRMMRCMIYDTSDISGIQPNVATGQMQKYDGSLIQFGAVNYNVWTRTVTMSVQQF